MADPEIVVVGAGPAGISTALFLVAQAPELRERLVVLDRVSHPREKICAGAIGGRADRVLEQIGVEVDVPSAWVRGLSVATKFGRLVADRDESIGRVVRRRAFDHAMVEIARQRGVRVQDGTGVVGLCRPVDDNSRVELALDDGSTLRARAVVGADGVGSRIRKSLGLVRGPFQAQAVEVDTDGHELDPDRHLLHFDVTDRSLRGYVWDFPTLIDGDEKMCRGVYELRSDETSARPHGSVDVGERLMHHITSLGLVGANKPKLKRFAERGLALNEPTAHGRVLLVGEAAGIDPVLGEGIAQAILYGCKAGTYLADQLRRGVHHFIDWPQQFSRDRIGWDLWIRTRLVPWVYDGSRVAAERFVGNCLPFARAGIHYFAGDRVPRADLARAAAHLAWSVTRFGLDDLPQ